MGLEQKDQPGRAKEEEVRKGIWGRTAKTKSHLRVCMENKYSRNFLKI